MAITEIVTPVLKSSHETFSIFKSQLRPTLHAALSKASGTHNRQVFGRIIYENSKPAMKFKFVLGLEWDSAEQFSRFMEQDDFKAFIGKLKDHVAGPPGPQIYDTDFSPTAAFSSTITEVFRIPIPNLEKESEARAAWKKLVDAAKAESTSLHELSGTSLNLEDRLFLGIIGWESLVHREKVLSQKSVKVVNEVVESLGGGSFIAEFGKAGVLPSD